MTSSGARRDDRPVVVFENALVCDWAEWAWVREALAGRFDTMLSNRPAAMGDAVAGRSGVARHDRRLGGRSFVAVGHSIGALMATELAARHPDRCRGLVLVDGSSTEQFHEHAPTFPTILWLRQELALRAARTALFRPTPPAAWLEDTSTLPAWARSRIRSSLRDPALWWRGYLDLSFAIRRHGRPRTVPRYAGPTWRVVASETAGAPEATTEAHSRFAVDRTESALVVDGADHASIVMDPAHAGTVADVIATAATSERRTG